nr:enolase-phosphatase E1-like [Aegilops tauschii subsp. strangulata]
MLALQGSSLEHLLRVLPFDGLSVTNPPPKGKQLGAGGGQVRLRRNLGGGCGSRTLLSLIQPGPEGSGPARVLRTGELQLQFARASAMQNKKYLGIDFNPGPAAPRPDGSHEADQNIIGPFNSFNGLLSHIAAQRATVEEAASEEEHAEVLEPPKPKKKSKASKPSTAPKASRVKPLQSAPPESSVHSEDQSRISKKSKKPKKISGHDHTPASILRTEENFIDPSSNEDLADDALEMLIKSEREAEIFKDLPLFDAHILNNFINEWFEDPTLIIDDLQLPIDIGVTFQGSIAKELAIAQKIAHNEAIKQKALGRPGIDPKLATKKKKKKPAEAEPETPRLERRSIIFPASMTGTKPKVPFAASEEKKTKLVEAEAKKRKHLDTSDAAPSQKKQKTESSKSSRKERGTPQEPLIIEPISIALPASTNREPRLAVHEPASTEAHEFEDIPAADSTAAKDIGHDDNVEDDEVLPQIQPNPVSSPTPTSSELINIGGPTMPITQDVFWEEQHPNSPLHEVIPRTPPAHVTTPVLETLQDTPKDMEKTTPSPKASPSFKRLCRGPRPSVSMSSIPEEDVHTTSSVACQVFPEAIPLATAQESEAKAVDDIPAASADEENEEDREVIPPTTDPIVQEEELFVPDPPVHEATNVEANVAATTTTTEANDVVKDEDNVQPEVIAATQDIARPSTSDVAIPPPMPHTMECAYNRGELVTVRWPILIPPIAPGP